MAKKLTKYQKAGTVQTGKSGISPDIFKGTESSTTHRRVQNKDYPNKYMIEKRPTPISADSLAKELDMERRKRFMKNALKKGGPVTALDQVQRMYSKKKK